MVGKSAAWISRLAKGGWIYKSTGGYRICDVAAGILHYRDDEDRKLTKTASYRAVEAARAKKIELDIAMKSRDLIPMPDAMCAIETFCGLVRTEFGGLPARLSRYLPDRKRVEDEVDGCLMRICNELERQCEILRNGNNK